ncbi:MAG: 50S ribosomal protein L24 [Rickettsiales bacterium]|nr:50S ribosomal protein L24 [Rickettsiales bacterium]
MAQKYKTNDEVIVISGSDKGKTGKIKSIKGSKVVVEGINIAKRHQKPTSNEPGKIAKVEKAIDISNISHVEDGKAVKIKFVIDKGEGKSFANKSRVSKKSGKKIGK